MDEYIGREVAKRAVDEAVELSASEYDMICDYLDRIPADDVAPVVHCKDCAHRTEMGNCGHPRYHGILPSAYPYDFCSYGARMDGDSDDANGNG